jgi:hypothetical protein
MAMQMFAAGRAMRLLRAVEASEGRERKERKEKKERKQQNKPLFLFIYFSFYLTGSGAYPRAPIGGGGNRFWLHVGLHYGPNFQKWDPQSA